jgi:hypothetical protein
MKSSVLLSLLAIAFVFSNCKKETTQVVQPNTTIYETLQVANWKFDASSNTYYNEISVPELTENAAQTDGVLVYITYDNEKYESLPDVLDGVSFIYTYQQGTLTVESQGADGSLKSPPTEAIGLKIVLIPSKTE